MRKLLLLLARPLEVLIGLTLLVSVLGKVIDINTFVIKMDAYGVFETKALLAPSAMLTLALESLLCCALLIGFRWKALSFLLLEGMLVFFSLLILYGWRCHDLMDCGCFGVLETSPQHSLAKNAVLFLLVALACWGHWLKKSPFLPENVRKVRLTGSLIFCVLVMGYSWGTLEARIDLEQKDSDDTAETARPFAMFQFDSETGPVDMGVGEYIVAAMSLTCEHCMEEAPGLNNLVDVPGVPPLVALYYEEEEGDIEEFREWYIPQYLMHEVSLMTYHSFVDSSISTFRVYLIKDGAVVTYWDAEGPDYVEILEIIESGVAAAPETPPAEPDTPKCPRLDKLLRW